MSLGGRVSPSRLLLCKVAARRRGKGTSHLSGFCCLWLCEALAVKLGRYGGSPSASCGPAHRGEGEQRPSSVWEEGKERVLFLLHLGCSDFSQVPCLPAPLPPNCGWPPRLCPQPSSSCDLIHSHRLSSCFGPAPSPVSGALTSLRSLASAFLMKLLHPGGVNSFPSPGKQPPLDHTAAHPRRPH